MQRSEVEKSLLLAFREEFSRDLEVLRREWERYKPSRKTKPDALPELRRVLHTVKGSTRLLGFTGVPEFVHSLEEKVLEALKKKAKPPELWDDLAELEELVAVFLDDDSKAGEPSWEGEPSALAVGATSMSRTELSSGYNFLLSVDELLALGEQLIDQLQIQGISHSHGSVAHQAAFLVERSKALRQEARRLALLPSNELFVGMTELARRTAADLGKVVSVQHRVQPDHLEREAVTVLRPGLLHLVVNAVAHGIDKEPGVIVLSYERHHDHLLVGVEDNGRGLSLQSLKEAVLRGRYLTEEEWDKLSPAEQLDWVFHPGLSTRDEADMVAGRGIGLAVVAESVSRLGGRVEVESSPQGTKFRLILPMDWNLRSVLWVRSAGHSFAVLSREIVEVEACSLEEASGDSLGELAELLGYSATVVSADYRLVVEHAEMGRVSIGVDALGEFEEVLVTLPPAGLTGLPEAMYGTAFSQGAPLPVVSLQSLVDRPPSRTLPSRPRSTTRLGATLLVVDDSITTRTLVTGILESAGFRVLVASDGKQGLELATVEKPAAIVSDLQMPIMDGLTFLEKLRGDPDTASLPFILLTSIDDVGTFEKASALGADRCLGKQNFSQELLLKTVRELL